MLIYYDTMVKCPLLLLLCQKWLCIKFFNSMSTELQYVNDDSTGRQWPRKITVTRGRTGPDNGYRNITVTRKNVVLRLVGCVLILF